MYNLNTKRSPRIRNIPKPMPQRWYIFFILINLLATGCANGTRLLEATQDPRINQMTIRSFDGTELAYTSFQAQEPIAIMIALHGMNDYAHTFTGPGPYWAKQGITVYAIDQRGFGRSNHSGKWPGRNALITDLHSVIAAVRTRHPHLPLFVLGHSMGGAVIMAAHEQKPINVEGIILAAPATWGGRQLPLHYRIALKIAKTFAPGKKLTGKRARRLATDNFPILRAMQEDPFIIKETRIDAVNGMVKLMATANKAANSMSGPVLYFYGCKDEILPLPVLERTRTTIRTAVHNQTQDRDAITTNFSSWVYPSGWHLLFRDLQAETVWHDTALWIQKQVLEAQNGKGVASVSPVAMDATPVCSDH